MYKWVYRMHRRSSIAFLSSTVTPNNALMVQITKRIFEVLGYHLAPGGAPVRLFAIALPTASLTSGSDRMVLFTNHSLTLPLNSFVPGSSPAKGAMSIASNLLASASFIWAIPSNLTSCCWSSCEELEDAVEDDCGKRWPS